MANDALTRSDAASTAPPLRRTLVSLATAILLLGIANSMVGAYLVLFASDEVKLSPEQVGALASAPAVGGIAVSWLLGRRFDSRPRRSYTVAVTVLGGLGLALFTRTRSFVLLIVVAATLVGCKAAAFPQLLSMARVILGDGREGQRSAPLLRSVSSLAWAIGPLIGAVLLARAGFTTILWAAAAILAVIALLVATAVPAPQDALEQQNEQGGASRPDNPTPLAALIPLTASIALFFTAMYAGSVALPLFVTRGLHETASTVGVLYSACAIVEVVAALALAALPTWISQRTLILSGMTAFIVYFALTVVAHDLTLLVAGQAARGIAIAVVSAAGIRYFQDLLTPAAGRATTLFANASTGGALLSGVLAGGAVSRFGYTTTLLLCAVVATAAAAAFAVGALASRHQESAADRAVRTGAQVQQQRAVSQ
jgi:MFS transporter, SET family, sugar efflux transporter